MKRLMIPIILLLIGVGGGVGAGFMLAPNAAAPTRTDASAGASSNPALPNPAPGQSAVSANGTTEFVRLSNQFVVPIVRNGAVRSMVVMSLTLETTTGQSDFVFEREPRLRDAFLQVMFAHANAGGFDGSFTAASAMDPLRESLGEAARQTLGAILHDVLIVDINRQDA